MSEKTGKVSEKRIRVIEKPAGVMDKSTELTEMTNRRLPDCVSGRNSPS
ncbi:hypothetical protein [Sporosarcina sp. A2]